MEKENTRADLEVQVQGLSSQKEIIEETLRCSIQNRPRLGLPLTVELKNLPKILVSRSPKEE